MPAPRGRTRSLGGGAEAFEERLRALRGHPVVADAAKRYRAEVAFLGLDSQDDQGSAEAFLQEFPVGFASISDRDARVAATYRGGQAWPTTIFFDRKG